MNPMDLFTFSSNGKLLLLGIGRPYTEEEKKFIRKVAETVGYNIFNDCRAGIYSKQEV